MTRTSKGGRVVLLSKPGVLMVLKEEVVFLLSAASIHASHPPTTLHPHPFKDPIDLLKKLGCLVLLSAF